MNKKLLFILFWPVLLMFSFEMTLAFVALGLVFINLTILFITNVKEPDPKKRFGARLVLSLFGLAGVLMVTYGSILYWPDRPYVIRDAVNIPDRVGGNNFFSFAATLKRTHDAGQTEWPSIQSFTTYAMDYYLVTDRYLAEIYHKDLLYSHVLPVLKQLPRSHGLRNTYLYKTHFPVNGPVYVQVGEYKIKFVSEFEDKVRDRGRPPIKDFYHHWKIDDIAPYKDVAVPPDFDFCVFDIFCWLPPPAKNF